MRYNATIKANMSTILMFGVFIIGWILVGVFVEGFGSFGHLISIIQLAGFLGIVAAGQNLVILTGKFDLSMGAMISFNGIFFALAYKEWGLNWVLMIFLTLLMGILLGAFNGIGVSILNVPPLVMTLASGSIFKGIALVITKGTSSFAEIPALNWFVNEKWLFGVNGVLLVWLICIIVVVFLLNKTTFGKAIYYTGSNSLAAHFSGISTKKIVIAVYMISGFISAIVGLLLVGFTGKSYFGMGDMYQFMSLAAVVVGGTSINGGKGSYIATVMGALLITLIQSVLTLLKMPYGGQLSIQGLIILLLVIAYSMSLREKHKI